MAIMNRRDFGKLVGKSVAVIPLSALAVSLPLRAEEEAVLVDPESPTAKALQYIVESDKGDICSGCLLYVEVEGKEYGGCSIFPGQVVPAGAWCSAYQPKPA